MQKKKKTVDQEVNSGIVQDQSKKEDVLESKSEVKYEFYQNAGLVIHCNKCNTITTLCMKDSEDKITPIVIKEGSLDLTKLIGGPMPTDNYSAFPLFCDTCKTMLSLRFVPIENNSNIEEAKIVEEVVYDEPQVSDEVYSSPDAVEQTESIE